MSFSKSVFICCFAIVCFSNCEDTQSKKKKQELKSSDTKNKSSNNDTPKANDSKAKKSNDEPFKLTNKNLRGFMADYGLKNPETLVSIKTKFGELQIELYKETPIHRANFIYLVKEKYFDETFFYRVAKGFVIQGGNSDRQETANKRFELGDYTVPHEPIKGLTHTRASVALSKQWVDNPSNRSTPFEFFIVVSKNGAHHLNGEHTIFGKVVKGMDVVDQIASVEVDGSEWPIENIFIKATVLK